MLIKFLKSVAFVIGSVAFYTPSSIAEDTPPFQMITGASSTGLRDQKAEDIKLGLESTVNQALAKKNIKCTFVFFKTSQDLAEAIASHEVTGMFGSPEEYLQSESFLAADNLGSATISGKDKSSFVLMVRKDSGIETLAQLKGKTLSSPKWVYTEMGRMYLENTLFEQKLPPPDTFFSKIDYPNVVNQSISKLFFKQVDAILVRDLDVDIAAELNPQIKQSFKIIAQSEPYLIFVASPLKTVSEVNRANVADSVFTLHKTAKGKVILHLMHIDNFHKIDISELDSVKRLINTNKIYKEMK